MGRMGGKEREKEREMRLIIGGHLIVYPLCSHLSFSNPLWMDWAMLDSIRST